MDVFNPFGRVHMASDDQPAAKLELAAGGAATVGGSIVGRDQITTTIRIEPTAAAARPQSELPHQAFFFGREEELAHIAEALDPETVGWGVLIDGAGGIGKTALAIRAGHLAPEHHYPTKIFLSAKRRDLTAAGIQPLVDFQLTDFNALLAELARELGEDEIAKGNPGERAMAVRRALFKRQALLIIDNVESFDDQERGRLLQFLRWLPRSCKAIVTSRRRMDVAAEVVHLDRLKPGDADKLIGKLAERNKLLARASGQERQQLYEISQGNPLLIEWLAGQLGRPGSQCRTIADAARFIERTPPENDPLEHIFGDLFAAFTEHEATVLAAVSHFTHPARHRWVAEVAGLAEVTARTCLEDLLDRALLMGDDAAQEFILLPLVAALLRRKHPALVTRTAERLMDSVFQRVLEGDLRDFRNYQRFPMLAEEWPLIAAALPHFLPGGNARLQLLCDALDRFLSFSGHWDDWLALSLQAEQRAAQEGDTTSAGRRAYAAGWVYRLRGQAEAVLACAHRAEAHWARRASPELALAIRLRGKGHQLAKDHPAAIAAFQAMIDVAGAEPAGSEYVAIGLNDLGWAEQEAGNLEAAERYYRQAMALAESIGYEEGVATNQGTLGDLALARQDWAATEAHTREALRLTEAMGHQLFIAYNCWRLALALARRGRPAEGQPYARRAIEIFEKLPSPELARAQDALRECEPGPGGADGPSTL